MKIVHIAPGAVYDDGWGFQDNILPKYHRKMGHDVTIIVSTRIHKGNGYGEVEPTQYYLDDGTRVIRLKLKKYWLKEISQLFARLDVIDELKSIKPDFIFFHSLCSNTMTDCIKYKKWAKKIGIECKIVQDNHLDYNIGNPGVSIRQKIARSYNRLYNRYTQKYVEKVYGVTPWRKEYAEEYYKISKSKTDVLLMGADDEYVKLDEKKSIRNKIRHQFNIKENVFLIVTGGKINLRKQIHLLINACRDLENVKLLIFGNVADDAKDIFFKSLEKNKNVIYIGWIDSSEVYNYFFAADLVFFPGQHSVLWEQACASKVPCVFQKWHGMDHINVGGNSDYIYEVSENIIREKIKELNFTPKYYKMKDVAESKFTDIYMYSEIAKKALECAKIKDKG